MTTADVPRLPKRIASTGIHAEQAEMEAWLDGGGDFDAVVEGGLTLLMIAALHGRESVVEMLLERKEALDLQDRIGYTALMWAARPGQPAAVRQLLAAVADTRLRSGNSRTALQETRDAECARLLRWVEQEKENKARALARWRRHARVVGFVAVCREAWDEVRHRPGNSGFFEPLADVEDALGGLTA